MVRNKPEKPQRADETSNGTLLLNVRNTSGARINTVASESGTSNHYTNRNIEVNYQYTVIFDANDSEEEVDCTNNCIKRSVSRSQHNKARKKRKYSLQNETSIKTDTLLHWYLENCSFYMVIHNDPISPLKSLCKLGQIAVNIPEGNNIPHTSLAKLLYLYVSDSGKCLLYWENEVSAKKVKVLYVPVICKVHYEAMYAFHVKKTFSIVLDSSISSTQLIFNIFLNEGAFYQLKYPSEPIWTTTNIRIKQVMKVLYGIEIKDYPELIVSKRQDIEGLYASLRQLQQEQQMLHPLIENVQHSDLLPTLRPYQADAVCWMLHREKKLGVDFHSEELHPLFIELNGVDGKCIYYNKVGGFFTKDRPIVQKSPCGGILADEMGLGKTVEVLACILCHPRLMEGENQEKYENEVEISEKICKINYTKRNDEFIKNDLRENKIQAKSSNIQEAFIQREYFECLCGALESIYDRKERIQCEMCGLWQHAECVHFDTNMKSWPYYCPHCWVQPTMALVPSKATLIVSPSSINYQWQEEIEKHVAQNSLRMLVYEGVQREGFIQPLDLSSYDIVLTTYETLRREINYVDLPHSNSELGRRFRHPKRFMSIPSPLVTIEWWRICLDEAQMVECTTTKTAEMALRLSAINRWCVTGTPIQKTVDDIYGLLLFVGADPFFVRHWWKEMLYKPYCHGSSKELLDVMKVLFWRTAKKDVLNQIGIPPQVDIVHWLNFSPVEEHFYLRQQQECSQNALSTIRKHGNLDIKLNSLDRHVMSQLLHPLRSLRQACCHPQAVRGQFLPIHKSTLTMEELLTSLIKKTKNECEEAHRQLIAALNGLAAIHVIHEEYVEASENYREVLRSVEDHRLHIKTDRMQQLHTLHNLSELLEGGISCTKSDNSIESFNSSVAKSLNFSELSKNEETTFDHSCELSFATDNNLTYFNSENYSLTNDINNRVQTAVEKNAHKDCNILKGGTSSDSSKSSVFHSMCIPHLNSLQNDDSSVTEVISSEKSVHNPPPGVGRALRDEHLQEEANKLRSHYLTKCASQVTTAQEQLIQTTNQLKEVKSLFSCHQSDPWWVQAISHCINTNNDGELVQKAKDDLLDIGNNVLSAAHRFHDARGFQYALSRLLDDLQTSHDAVSASVRELSSVPTISEINAAVDCHLRPSQKNRQKCRYCTVHELFNHYEGKLFYFNEDVSIQEPTNRDEALFKTLRRGTWADSELERMLKSLLSFCRTHRAGSVITEDGNIHMKLFEILKKEFRALRGVWMQIRDYVSAVDELDMATIRLRVRFPDEPKPDPPLPYVLEPEEVEQNRLKLLNDRAVAQSELRKKLGQLFYLQNLAKADFGQKGGSNPDPCPICQRQLGVQWSVLQCGHSFCVECIRVLITEYSVGGRNPSVRCAVCRQLTSHGEISYINTELNSNKEEVEFPVKGSHSTKIEGIVRCLLQIRQQDPQVKALVFSTWQDVLDVLAKALEENAISYISLHAHNKFQNNLARFKYEPEVTALLLPVHSGANGLNLIEATHVLLVEPLLNPASEQQALGRVHRIGQGRSTTIHRFAVRGTIEERIHQMLQPYQPSMTKLNGEDLTMSLGELKALFEG